jgi:hypothetical protein
MVNQTLGALRLAAQLPYLVVRTGWRVTWWGVRTGDQLLRNRLSGPAEQPAPWPDEPSGRQPTDIQNDVTPRPPTPDQPPAPSAGRQEEEPPALDELAIPDIDHLTVPSLRSRIRRLDATELRRLRAYEAAHAHRLPVLTAIDNRLAAVSETQEDEHATGPDKGREAVSGTTS